MKRLILLGFTSMLFACSPETKYTGKFVLPDDLSHCRVIELNAGEFDDRVYLIKCPAGTVPDGYIGTSSMQKHGKTMKAHAVAVM